MEMLRLFTDRYKNANGDIDDYVIKDTTFKPSFTEYCIDLEVYALDYLFG